MSLKYEPPWQVCMMSATMDGDVLGEYFHGIHPSPPLHVPNNYTSMCSGSESG